MDQIVELKRVYLARIQPHEPLANPLEQQSQLLLVVSADREPGGATTGTPNSAIVTPKPIAHDAHPRCLSVSVTVALVSV